MNQEELETILARPEHREYINQINQQLYEFYYDKNILITGGNGSLGRAIADWFDDQGLNNSYLLTDVDTLVRDRQIRYMNVLDQRQVNNTFALYCPDVVFHFAAQKHAPDGEENPLETCQINIDGTRNILNCTYLEYYDNMPRIVVASTCKSIHPETSYGASKLVADRLTMNCNQTVVRYFNVVQSSGNVFEIWDEQGEPYFVTQCHRFFISIDEAVALTLFAGTQESGRYIINPGGIRSMEDIASDLYGVENTLVIPRRRGDREQEPVIGDNEFAQHVSGPILKVVNYNDKK